MNIFDIRFIVLTLFDYKLSLLELTGTLSGMLSVFLTAREKVSCWPVGIINILLFFILFYQVQLYSDMLLQVYFLVMSVYGWWMWTHPKNQEQTGPKKELKISNLTVKQLVICISLSAAGVLILGFFMKDIHKYLPHFFPVQAAFPFPDAFTTIFSITATVLMAGKKRECWLCWIAVDVVATTIYFLKGINLVAVEYIIFGMIALQGYLNWSKLQAAYSRATS